MNAIELFAGAGGAGTGIAQAGLEALGIEISEPECQTRERAGLPTLRADVTELDPADYSGVEGLWASPPCQDHSRAGRRAGRDGESGALVDLPLDWARPETGKVGEILALFVDLRAQARDRGEPWPDPEAVRTGRLPTTEEEWQGRARLARARALAGLELDDTDRAALKAYPNPPSAIFAGELLPSLDELLEPPS